MLFSKTPFSIAAACIAAMLTSAQAGSLFTFTFTDDLTSQISSAKTYTTALDPGQGATATINGVVFEAGTLTGTGFDSIVTGTNVTYANTGGAGNLSTHIGNSFDLPSGQSGIMLTDMVYTASAQGQGNVTTLTLSGLTPGLAYSARIYYRAWDAATARPSTIFFDEDGPGPLGISAGSIDEDLGNNSDGIANVLGYNYTAVEGQDMVITFTAEAINNSWHLYGVTNEVIPEPGSFALLAAAGCAIAARRSRGFGR